MRPHAQRLLSLSHRTMWYTSKCRCSLYRATLHLPGRCVSTGIIVCCCRAQVLRDKQQGPWQLLAASKLVAYYGTGTAAGRARNFTPLNGCNSLCPSAYSQMCLRPCPLFVTMSFVEESSKRKIQTCALHMQKAQAVTTMPC